MSERIFMGEFPAPNNQQTASQQSDLEAERLINKGSSLFSGGPQERNFASVPATRKTQTALQVGESRLNSALCGINEDLQASIEGLAQCERAEVLPDCRQ